MGIFPGLEYDNVVVINHPNPERRCRNELYGVDCHISTLDFEVVDGKGAIKKKACVNNGAKEFMEFVKSIPKPRKIFIEEGELASWLLETSLRFGEQLIIIDPRGNKWISKAKQKNDSVDATKIAQLIVEDIKADLEKSGASVKVGTIVLIHTGRDKYMGTKDYWLKGTGIDQWGWGTPLKEQIKSSKQATDPDVFLAAHRVGIKKEYCHIEQMVNLGALPAFGFMVSVLPLKIVGASAAPARVVAILED